MTWVGWLAVVICLLAFAGNFVQWMNYRSIKVDDKWTKRCLMGGLIIAFILNSTLFLGILYVGTGSLF